MNELRVNISDTKVDFKNPPITIVELGPEMLPVDFGVNPSKGLGGDRFFDFFDFFKISQKNFQTDIMGPYGKVVEHVLLNIWKKRA